MAGEKDEKVESSWGGVQGLARERGRARASTSEHRGSRGKQRGSIFTKRALAGEQSGEA